MTKLKKSRLQEIREIRLGKVAKLRELGIDPYPARTNKEYSNIQITTEYEKFEGKTVTLAGRLMSWREHGNIAFGDLQDESGKIQIFVQKKELAETSSKNQTIGFKELNLLDIGDFLQVRGKVGKTVRGEISITPSEIKILTKSIRPIPDQWHGLKDVEERYRQRYVDMLLNSGVQEVFRARAKFVTEIRKFMDNNGFLEVETPILQPIYGGASAAPFITHHNTLDTDLYLRISNELYLKRLIVGGFEKVYEIGKDFRNEGMDRQHNPEFTQMEFYWAYADYENLMDFTEEMLSSAIKKINGSLKIKHEDDVLDFTTPWTRVTFRDLLLRETGIDIDKEDTEDKLKKAIRDKKLEIDFEGVVGYGILADTLYKNYARPKLVQPTLLLDYPSEMIALAKRRDDNPKRIASFQLLIKGFEVIKAYNELNDPVDQKERWLEEEKLGERGLEEHMVLDEDYIRALEYGMPPTAGWGIGIDRITSFLTNQRTLKETIIFPTLRPKNKKEKSKK